jgi:hypothetical protein
LEAARIKSPGADRNGVECPSLRANPKNDQSPGPSVVVRIALERRPPPRPAFLFVTGYADGGPYEEFIRAMQAPVMIKPFGIDVLRETVSRLLGGI